MTRRKRYSKARLLHRFLGAGAGIFVIFMVVSGLFINHSGDLGLDRQNVSQGFLLNWYGLDAPEQIHSHHLGDDWLSFAGSQLYFNARHVSPIANGIGAVMTNEMIVAAGSDELLLLDHNGNMIERINWGQPDAGSIESIGQRPDGRVVIKSTHQLWLSDVEILNWELTTGPQSATTWSVGNAAPATLQKDIARQYQGDGLNLERILLDLHSGRFFGTPGMILYDLLAISVGLMAISGLVLWVRSRRNGNRKRQ